MKQLFARCHVFRQPYHDHIYRMVIAFLCLSQPMPVQAQQAISNGATIANLNTVAESDVGFKFGSVIVAPIPFSNDLIGSGLVLGAGYLFNLPGSKPSGFGIGALKTGNGSEGYFGGGSVNFGEGRWTLGLFGGTADVSYDLPVGSLNVPLQQSGDAIDVFLEYGLTPQLTAGVSVGYLEFDDFTGQPGLHDFAPDFAA